MAPIKASIYYLLLTLYTTFYLCISICLYFAESCFQQALGIDDGQMAAIGYYRRIKYFYSQAYFMIWKLLGVRIYVRGDIRSDPMIWISNHRSKLDGLVVQTILCGNDGLDVVSILKNSIKYVPIYGSFSKYCSLIFIERKWSSAETILRLGVLESSRMGRSILIFPEGTTISPDSKARSDFYASERGMVPFKNLLLPRTRGFSTVREVGEYGTIGNITIGYDQPSSHTISKHSYLDLFSTFPTKIYFRVDYVADSLFDMVSAFRAKDKYLERIVEEKYKPYVMPNTCWFLNLVIFPLFLVGLCVCSVFRWLVFLMILGSAIRTSVC